MTRLPSVTDPDWVSNCYTCDFFNDLNLIAHKFTSDIFNHFGSNPDGMDAADVLAMLIGFYVVVFATRMMAGGGDRVSMNISSFAITRDVARF